MSLIGAMMRNADTKTPVPLVSRATGAFSSLRHQRGATQALTAMEAASVVFGIVDRLATSVSLVEWKLWRKSKSGKPEEREEVTSHLALDILNSPNDYYSRQELMEAAQQHQELTGESWLVVSRNPRAKSIPLELWPVRPDRMEPVPSPDTYLAGYEYRAPDGECVPLRKDDVLFVRRPDPNHPYRGLGPIRSVLTDVDSIRLSMEWNKNFFANSAEPGGIVEIDRRLSDDEFDELVARWREQHQGVAQAHRVAILEQVKWVDRKYTMRDMQFTELRGVTEAGVKLAFGFPKFALGEVDDVNRAQGEASIAMYAKWLIVPRLERWKGVFNRRFLPMFGTTGQGLEFDYVSPVSEDSEAENAARTSRVGAVAALVPLGFDAKESLKAFDLPDIPWEKPEPPDPPAGAFPGGKPKPSDEVMAYAHRMLNITPRVTNQAPPEDPELEQVQRDWEQALAALMAGWVAVTAAQKAQILAQVSAAVAAGNLPGLAAMTVSTEAAQALLVPALTGFAALSGETMATSLAGQGAPLVAAGVPSLDTVESIAAAVALLLATGLLQRAARAAVAAFRPGVPAREVVAAVETELDSLSASGLQDQLGGALTTVQNQARLLTAQAVEVEAGAAPVDPDDPQPPADEDDYIPQVIYYSSEVNDKNTCWPCHNVDGTEYERWIDAWVDYGGGKYRGCLGRNRCRGTVKARWNPQAGQ